MLGFGEQLSKKRALYQLWEITALVMMREYDLNQKLCGWKNKLLRDSLWSLLERSNVHRCVFRKMQVHLTGEAEPQRWIWGHRNWESVKSISKKWTYFFFFFRLLLPLSLLSLFFLSHYCLLNLNPGLNGNGTVSRGTIKIRNFRKKYLMRGLEFLEKE